MPSTANALLNSLPSPAARRGVRDRLLDEAARAEAAEAHARRMIELTANLATVRARCRRLADFVREAWHVLEPVHPYVHGKHIDVICEVLEAITFGRLLAAGLRNRIVFNVPPGTMKSLLISVFWPAWEWTMAPHLRIMSSSHNRDFVKRDTRKMRDLVSSDWYQALWGDTVRLVREGETSFANDATGNREGVTCESLTSGRGYRVLIDDPQNTESAESEADRIRDTRVARESLQSRINDPEKSAIVVIQQRLHTDDTSGVLLGLNIGYLHVNLPMYYDPATHFSIPKLGIQDWRKQDGELLWPERMPPSYLAVEAIPLGQHGVATQWQQRPTPRGGGMFQRAKFRLTRTLPAGTIRWVRAWDFAASEPKIGQRPDWTVGIKVGLHISSRQIIIARIVRLQVGPATVHETVKNIASQDGVGCTIRIPQDPGQAGKDQASVYIKELMGYAVIAKPISKDKPLRARPAATQVDAGNVLILASGDPAADMWIETFLAEAEVFPRGQHDDQIDAFADAVTELALGDGYQLTEENA